MRWGKKKNPFHNHYFIFLLEIAGTYDSSSSPVETSHPTSTYHMSVDIPARSMAPRRSCSDIPISIQHDPSSQQQQQQPSRSPRPSISSRSGSGSQQGSERRSIERAAISIIIDDVDSSIGSSAPPAAAPVAVNNSYVVQLHRDHSRSGGGSFTSGFGLNLSGRYSGAVIARIEPHGNNLLLGEGNKDGVTQSATRIDKSILPAAVYIYP